MRSNKLTFFLNIGLFNKNLTNKLDKKLLKNKTGTSITLSTRTSVRYQHC